MAYNDEYSGRLIIDLETAPIADAATYIEPVSAPSNYKDPVKIAAYITEEQAKKTERAALDPDLCRIVALGRVIEDSVPRVWLCRDEDEERAALQAFWDGLKGFQIVGFNVNGFDVPVLLRRSQYLGVKTPRLQVEKYRHPQIIDLMLELSFNGMLSYHGLDFYCKRFALDVPADATTGAQMPDLVAAGDWAAIEAHLTADLQKTAALAERLGHFRRVEAAVL